MKKTLFLFLLSIFSCLVLVMVYGPEESQAGSGFCFICGSGSSCDYCISPSGKDTWDDRKYCKSKGCKVSGTTTCSGAANYKYCK